MIVLLFILGILAIIGISRYNESNKLFWTLFFSFVGMFAVGTVAGYAIGASNKSKDHHCQVCPTQANVTSSSNVCSLADGMLYSTTSDVTGPVPVSKDYIFGVTDDVFISGKIVAEARDQPNRFKIDNIPIYQKWFFNTS